MNNYSTIASLRFDGGLNTASPLLSPISAQMLSRGSWNAVVSGDGFIRPFSGCTSLGSGSGSAIMMPFGSTWGGIRSYHYADKTFAAPSAVGTNQVTVTGASDYVTGMLCTVSSTGTLPTGLAAATDYYIIVVDATHLAFASSLANALLSVRVPITSSTGTGTVTIDVSNATVTASGSWMQDIGQSRWGIGSGQPQITGVSVPGFELTTNLQLQIRSGGAYQPPVQAGLTQPSTPDIGIVNVPGTYTASVSAKISRSRPSTGAVSLASETSDVVFPQGNRIRLTFPLVQAGQTHWRAFFTFQGFGGVGVHYLGTYDHLQDIPESVVAASSVDGIDRTLEFNLPDGNLIQIEASFDDYPPPAATHAVRLNTVMNLCGCYSDAVQRPTPTDSGTCIAVSKENNYESYVPTSLLYLPEPVVDVMARPVDDYAFVGCRNSIHALQYVGNRGDDLPSCTITAILPDIGVEYPHNWTFFRGQLLIYTAQGTLMLMSENGSFDTSFANPVADLLAASTTASTVTGYDPRTDSIVIGSGQRLLVYSLQAQQWRQIWLPDFNIEGSVVSMTTSRQHLYISILANNVTTAYTYNTGSLVAPVSLQTNYQNVGGVVVNDIYEMALAASIEGSGSLVAAISTDLIMNTARDLVTTASSTTVTSPTLKFPAALVGQKVVLFGAEVGGIGTQYLITTIEAVPASNQLQIATPAFTSLTNVLAFFGSWVGAATLNETEHLPNFFPYLAEVRSFSVGVWFRSEGSHGNVLSCDLLGATYASSRAK